jgi:hypothetical protein
VENPKTGILIPVSADGLRGAPTSDEGTEDDEEVGCQQLVGDYYMSLCFASACLSACVCVVSSACSGRTAARWLLEGQRSIGPAGCRHV